MTGSAVVGAVLALKLLLLRFGVIVFAVGDVIVRVGLRAACAAAVACRWRAFAPFPTAFL